MKKIVAIILAIIVSTSMVLGYTTTVKVKGFGAITTSEPGNEVTIVPKVDINGWQVNSGGITVNNNKFTMPEADVDIEAIIEDENEEIEDIPIGVYIAYAPTANVAEITNDYTGVGDATTKQSFTIDKNAKWKVFKNDNGKLDIISAESIGELTLQGEAGYKNAVYVLNTLASQYVNEYAESARSLGSTDEWIEGPTDQDDVATYGTSKSVGIIDTTEGTGYPITWDNTYTDGNTGFPYTDSTYSSDQTIINTEVNGGYPLRHSSETVWLASRLVLTDSSYSSFRVRGLDSSGSINHYYLYYSRLDGSELSNSYSGGVRPVVSLKAGVKISGGSGTESDPYTITYEQPANAPVLGEGMTPVNWNGSNWVETNEANWDYNYNSVAEEVSNGTVEGNGSGKWANAKTSDGSMWVWIPRYTYKIVSGEHQSAVSWNSDLYNEGTDTAGKIEIKFSIGTIDDTSGGYIAHPAFTFGEDELEGFWVAKYEASRSDATESSVGIETTVSSRPGVRALSQVSVSDMYDYAYNYNRELDSHLMRNSEWGAVAYLTNAIGRIPYINNNSYCITGDAGATQNATESQTTSSWNTVNGVKASTTHNVYGIYDLNGARRELVSAYYIGGDSTYLADDVLNKEYGGSLYINRDSKYVETYSAVYSSEVFGDAIYETSSSSIESMSWDSDYSFAPTSVCPFFGRGGGYNIGLGAGIFYFNYNTGDAYAGSTFRPALTGFLNVETNAPVLGEGMTPVNWNGSNWVETNESNWDYNYNSVAEEESNGTVAGNGNGKWANAKTDDGSMWVWIPRYTYKIESGYHETVKSWNSDLVDGTEETLGKISVKFSNGITDDTTNGYIAHPAFTLGTDELEGFWVAKYEMSMEQNGSNVFTGSSGEIGNVLTNDEIKMVSKPDLYPWCNISASKAFINSYNYNEKLDSHMMKNIEWGAVAYLTNAVGRIPYINLGNGSYHVTGFASDTEDAEANSPIRNNWNSIVGVKGSTTHNVYGIYDMSGGAVDRLAAFWTGGDSVYLADDVGTNTYLGALYEASTSEKAKYVDIYPDNYSSNKIGDAMYETSSIADEYSGWDSDLVQSFSASRPGVTRGNFTDNASGSGIFASVNTSGAIFGATTFRTVLTGLQRETSE